MGPSYVLQLLWGLTLLPWKNVSTILLIVYAFNLLQVIILDVLALQSIILMITVLMTVMLGLEVATYSSLTV